MEYTERDAKVNCGQWCQGGMARLVMSDADRSLIAAAPDLLQFVRDLAQDRVSASMLDEWFEATRQQARELVARATGAQHV